MMIEIPENKIKIENIKDYSTTFCPAEGPFVDISFIDHILYAYYTYDTIENKRYNNQLKITYNYHNYEVVFIFEVLSMELPKGYNSNDIVDDYYYTVHLYGITFQNHSLQLNQYYKYFSFTMVQLEYILFFTDMIMNYEYCGNPLNLPDKWWYKSDLIEKYYKERKELNEIRKDF